MPGAQWQVRCTLRVSRCRTSRRNARVLPVVVSFQVRPIQ
jgi:hypothetical protein